MRNVRFCFVIAMVIGNTVSMILLASAINSYSHDYIAEELFPDAEQSTHVLLMHTKLVKGNGGSEIPTIQEVRIQRGRYGPARSQPGDEFNQDQYRIEMLDRDRNSIFRVRFHYPRVITVPPLPEGMPPDGKRENSNFRTDIDTRRGRSGSRATCSTVTIPY